MIMVAFAVATVRDSNGDTIINLSNCFVGALPFPHYVMPSPFGGVKVSAPHNMVGGAS